MVMMIMMMMIYKTKAKESGVMMPHYRAYGAG